MNPMMATAETGSGLRGNATGYGSVRNKIPQGYKLGRIQQFTPEQMNVFQGLQSHIAPDSYLSRLAGGDQSAYQQMEAPAFDQFQEVLGDIGSRFSGAGLGARRGSGFNLATSRAGQEFAQNLASRRQELQRQAMQDLFGLSNMFLGQRPQEQFLVKKQPSFWQSLLGGGAGAIGAGAGGYFGGPAGAQAGAQIGSGFGQAFGGY